MTLNPFPGPRPYAALDRERFFGRKTMAHALGGSVMAHTCLTIFGPSGAGKSSLMRAAVIPELIDTYDIRAVCVDSWPKGEPPGMWVVKAMFEQLHLGTRPPTTDPGDAIVDAAKRAAMRSDGPVVIFLDQLERLLLHDRNPSELDEWVVAIERLATVALPGFHVVLSLREDYLGPLHDHMQDRRRLTDYQFRVSPLTVGALADAVCDAATTGEPPLTWTRDLILPLMVDIRVPGQTAAETSEAQAAYAQIVCRALFEQGWERKNAKENVNAEAIVQRYLERTLDGLGTRSNAARQILETQFIAEDGSRTLRTEKELLVSSPIEGLGAILTHLEHEAVLRAEEHQGSKYYELGHDWLANWVFGKRQERARAEKLRVEQQKQAEKLRVEQQKKAEQVRREQRRRRNVGIFVVSVIASLGGFGWYSWWTNRNEVKELEEATTQYVTNATKNLELLKNCGDGCEIDKRYDERCNDLIVSGKQAKVDDRTINAQIDNANRQYEREWDKRAAATEQKAEAEFKGKHESRGYIYLVLAMLEQGTPSTGALRRFQDSRYGSLLRTLVWTKNPVGRVRYFDDSTVLYLEEKRGLQGIGLRGDGVVQGPTLAGKIHEDAKQYN